MTNLDLHWMDSVLELNGYSLIQEWGDGIGALNPEFPSFALMKSRDVIEAYMDFLLRIHDRPYRRILELGIMKGGSCVFFNELLGPSMHAAIDLNTAGPEALSRYREVVEKTARELRLGWGVSQTDIAAIRNVAGPEPLDLVVDDCSHDYALSRCSFENLFPLVASGGVYALEDWGWAHWPRWQQPTDAWADKPALSNLVFELSMVCSSSPEIIAEIHLTRVAAFLVRGPAAISRLDLDANYVARGRKLTHI